MTTPEAAAGLPIQARAEPLELVRLVEAAQRQDRTAFTGLYRLFARMVHGILLSRVPRGDVDDLLQDVFVQAMEHIGTLRDPAAVGGWLASIARNRATDHHRRAVPTTELVDNLSATDPDRLEAMAILDVIRTLPDAYRETLTLRLVEGMSGPEIAERTGLTDGSVRVNLH